MESIIVALITGGLSLIGVIITTRNNSKRMEQQLQTAQAVTDTKIDELTREVRYHNGFAERLPVLEEKTWNMERRIIMKDKTMREWLYRAGRTALQAAAGAVAANLVAWVGGVTDIASLKTVAISAGSVIISAVLAALMNMDKNEE